MGSRFLCDAPKGDAVNEATVRNIQPARISGSSSPIEEVAYSDRSVPGYCIR